MTCIAFRTILLASIALPALSVPVLSLSGAALAQTAAAAAAAPAADTVADSVADSGADTNDAEIIVTASKRSATLQDTPISVSVTTAASIEQSQIRDLKDLQTLVPSLKVNQLQSSANTNFSIRGFGNGANNAGIEPSVGVFIDGVYRSRSAAQIGDLPNIERVEVLRGPQSTLFGKNASAGIISIITQEPKFALGANAEISYGNYNALILKASITAPITEKLAFSLAGNYNRRDGYGRDLALDQATNNRNRWGVRGQLLFKPTEDLKFRLIGDYDRIDENCCLVANLVFNTAIPVGPGVSASSGSAVNAVGGRVDVAAPFSYRTYTNAPSTNKIDNYGVSLQSDWRINDKFALTSITAYRGVRIKTNQDSDFTSADLIGDNKNNTRINTFTSEARLATTFDGPVNFLAGAFYFNEDIKIDADLTFGRDFLAYANAISGGNYSGIPALLRLPANSVGQPGQGRFEKYSYKDRSISIFGQVDFVPFEGLTLTAGGNYTDDSKQVATDNRSTDLFSTLDFAAIGAAAFNIPPALAGNPQFNPLLTLRAPNGASLRTGLDALQFLPQFLNFPNAVESGHTRDTNFSYTLRAAYKINRNLNVYFTYATGFKPTSFNLSTDSRPFARDFIPGSPITSPAASAIRTAGLALPNLTTGTRYAGPENSQVFEGGVKGNFEGFSFNLAVFQQSISGFQSNIFTGTGFVLDNAEKQSTFGVEFDTSITPVKDINFTFNMTYLKPKFDRFTRGSTFVSDFSVVQVDLSGVRPAGIPEFSIAVGANFKHQFNDNLKGFLHIDYNLDSPVQIALGLPTYRSQNQSLNSTFTLGVGHGVELSVWGRNIANSQFLTTIFPSVAQTGSLSGYPSQPRTYGVAARIRY
jgi:outer membrane receptor protein involved in Fe transport